MALPFKVDQCCCGCTLKTGTILIAMYYIVSSSLLIALTSGFYLGRREMNRTAEMTNATNHTGSSGMRLSMMKENRAMYSLVMIYSALSIVLNVMLLLGAKTEQLRLIYVWIIAHMVYLVITMIGLVANMFMTLMNANEKTSSFVSSLLNIVLTFYFLVVVSSYYEQIKDRQSITSTSQAPPDVVYIDNNAPPPAYSELYPPWPQQNMTK